jgi:molybdopterin converting factor small subunit
VVMKITVEYWAQLKVAAGMRAELVEVESNCTVIELVKSLAERHGQPLRDLLIDAEGKPRVSNVVSMGERIVPWGNPPPLKDGDVVAILSPIAGG